MWLALLTYSGAPQIIAYAAATDNPTVWLFNLGTAGVWLVCYLTGLLPTRQQLQDAKEDAQRTRDEKKEEIAKKDREIEKRDLVIDAMRDQLANRTIPALAGVRDVIADYPRVASVREEKFESKIELLLAKIDEMNNGT